MGKRTARDDGDDDDAEARQAQCRGTMKALNAQFAQWVAERAVLIRERKQTPTTLCRSR